MRSLPAAPDLALLPSGSVYVALGPDGLGLVVDTEDGETRAAILWWGAEALRGEVGEA